MPKILVDLTGQKFHRLTVLREGPRKPRQSKTENRLSGQRSWDCQCECGTLINVLHCSLARNTKSCGCWNSHVTAERNRANRGKPGKNGTHYMSKSPEYETWTGVIKRTENPNCSQFHDYGGRGIKMCPEWRKSFVQFYADMGPKPTPKHEIERRDNDGNYCPENCYWATKTEQAHNKRNNVWITYNDETLCLSDWGRRLNTSAGTIRNRILSGWSVERAVTTPVKRKV